MLLKHNPIKIELENRMRITPDFPDLDKTLQIVFVYGTLKRGFGNHRLLEGRRYLGRGVTFSTNFVMKNTGGFPVLLKTSPDTSSSEPSHAYGEVYDANALTMHNLDRLESNGIMYERQQIMVSLIDQQYDLKEGRKGTPYIKAWTYIGVPTYWQGRGLSDCNKTILPNFDKAPFIF